MLFTYPFSHTHVITPIPREENHSSERTKRSTANNSLHQESCTRIWKWWCYLKCTTRVPVTSNPYCALLSPWGVQTRRCRAHVPFGGCGCSGGDVGHHGVIHVSQRPRRTRTEILIPVSDLRKNQKTQKETSRALGKRTSPSL